MFFLSIPLYEPKKSHDLSLNSKISTDKDIESTNTVQGQFTDWYESESKMNNYSGISTPYKSSNTSLL
jgi:hypothetical protein